MNSKRALEFFEFVYKRQEIKFNKDNGIVPLTEDEILSKFKFCNVRRVDDACTQHLISHVITRKDLKQEDVLLNIILFRFFNTRYFFTEVLDGAVTAKKFAVKTLEKKIDEAKAKGVRLYNTAYMICGVPVSSYRKADKHVQILLRIEKILQSMAFTVLAHETKARTFCRALVGLRQTIGTFLAYQMMLDYSYYLELKGKQMAGLNDYVDIGPGALPALEYIFPEHTNTLTKKEEACIALCVVQDFYFKMLKTKTKLDWKRICGATPKIELSDIENCLCEFRKYKNLKAGFGKKRYYKKGE